MSSTKLGGTISWTSASIQQQSSGSVNSGDDSLLDVGTDSFLASDIVFTGYTIGFEGETYAIFGRQVGGGREAQYYIPYNPADANLAPLTAGGFTSIYTGNGAQVFNCFARGTRIATPDSERIVETLKPGDLVLTHDGRSTPAIWVARQTVANPRFVELGRKPVRIDAGALGPDLPDAPLTLTADHALTFGDMLVNAGARWRRTEPQSASCRFRSCRRASSGGMWSLRTMRSFRSMAAFPRRALSIMSAGPVSTITANISTSPGPTV